MSIFLKNKLSRVHLFRGSVFLLHLSLCLYIVSIFILPPSLSARSELLDLSVFSVKGFEGTGQVEFNAPEGIALTVDGRIIVADSGNNRLQVLTADGDFIKFIPDVRADLPPDSPEAREARENFAQIQKLLLAPTGLHVDKSGLLYVACRNSHKIVIIDIERGTLAGTIGEAGSKQGMLGSPIDVSVCPRGRIAVADWKNARVNVFSRDGAFLKEFIYQEEKRNRSVAVAPRGVFWSPTGELIVVYPLFNQVVSWNFDNGEVVWRYGVEGSAPGMLNNPSFVTSGPDGHLLISDTKNNRVVQVTANGLYFENYSIRRGSAPGRLSGPRGLALTKTRTLVVADQGNNRIHFFEPGKITLMLREIKAFAVNQQWEKALPEIEKILQLQPNNQEARELMVNALYYFGDKAFEEGDYDKSESFFRRILIYSPNDSNVSHKLDAIFWASNKGLVAKVVFGALALIGVLIIIWLIKYLLYRFIFTN